MLSFLCHLGVHSWPRVHSSWHEPAVSPSESNCRRCQKPIRSIWRVAYPEDGTRCGRTCQVHRRQKKAEKPSQLLRPLGRRVSDESEKPPLKAGQAPERRTL